MRLLRIPERADLCFVIEVAAIFAAVFEPISVYLAPQTLVDVRTHENRQGNGCAG